MVIHIKHCGNNADTLVLRSLCVRVHALSPTWRRRTYSIPPALCLFAGSVLGRVIAALWASQATLRWCSSLILYYSRIVTARDAYRRAGPDCQALGLAAIYINRKRLSFKVGPRCFPSMLTDDSSRATKFIGIIILRLVGKCNR